MILSSLSLALILLGGPAEPQLTHEAFARKLADAAQRSALPGAALQVLQDGKVLHQQAFGLANLQDGRPYTAELAFEIGSLSKQFTATAVLLLVHDGKLALSDALGTLLPELPQAWRPATVEQVMHHVSGIPDYETIAGYDYYNQPHTPREVIDCAARQEPAFAPGQRFEYSNTGYFLLSLIVEQRGGMPFERFLEQRIFAPLGMHSTYTARRPPGVEPASGYHDRTGTRVQQPPIAWSATLGAGGIVSTLGDLALWDEALYTDRLLPAKLRSVLWDPTRATDGSTIPYGAGWFTETFRDVSFLSHSGQTNGFTCSFLRFPEAHMSVLACTNTYGGDVDSLARSAAIHFLPTLSYAALPVPRDDDPETTAEHLSVLREALSGDGDLERLASPMKAFATGSDSAGRRAALTGRLEPCTSFRFLRMRPFVAASGPVEEFLYRQSNGSDETYWTLRFGDGLLLSIGCEDE